MTNESYFPSSEQQEGWRSVTPESQDVNIEKFNHAIGYHLNNEDMTKNYGGALIVIHQGKIISENYTTGTKGGPQPWNSKTCNDMCSSTKSVFGTAVGVFLDEHKDKVNLETDLVGKSRETSLIPQIWDQPLTDERKKDIKIKHAISMTSGHETKEPWDAPTPRHHFPDYTGAFQMMEYCFGWWYFEDIPHHHTLLFQPGNGFNYSNYGMEQVALAMKNITGEELGPYIYDRVLKQIGIPIEIRDVRYREMPEMDGKALNYSDQPGWAIGGSDGCDAYGADKSNSPYGFNSISGSSFRCTARDFARLGYLWLRKGKWGNQQLVPQEWMDIATKRFQRDNGETPNNYGYGFWILDDLEGVPKDAFMSKGFNMNDCYVIPSLDLIVVRQGNENINSEERQAFSNTLIQKIVAAFKKT
jgi:CubicO group peptidase (beta-lactamase class C family)